MFQLKLANYRRVQLAGILFLACLFVIRSQEIQKLDGFKCNVSIVTPAGKYIESGHVNMLKLPPLSGNRSTARGIFHAPIDQEITTCSVNITTNSSTDKPVSCKVTALDKSYAIQTSEFTDTIANCTVNLTLKTVDFIICNVSIPKIFSGVSQTVMMRSPDGKEFIGMLDENFVWGNINALPSLVTLSIPVNEVHLEVVNIQGHDPEKKVAVVRLSESNIREMKSCTITAINKDSALNTGKTNCSDTNFVNSGISKCNPSSNLTGIVSGSQSSKGASVSITSSSNSTGSVSGSQSPKGASVSITSSSNSTGSVSGSQPHGGANVSNTSSSTSTGNSVNSSTSNNPLSGIIGLDGPTTTVPLSEKSSKSHSKVGIILFSSLLMVLLALGVMTYYRNRKINIYNNLIDNNE